MVTELKPNQIFVFGSNKEGNHSGGAAYTAYKLFGAEMGNGAGPQGQSYAIPTMDGEELFQSATRAFVSYAKAHPKIEFLLTPIGTGIAGYTYGLVELVLRRAMPDGWPKNIKKVGWEN